MCIQFEKRRTVLRRSHLYEVVEHHERQQDDEEDGCAVGDDEHRGDHRRRYAREDTNRHRNVNVDRVNVLREAVHDPTDRCRFEERHRRAQHPVKQSGIQRMVTFVRQQRSHYV